MKDTRLEKIYLRILKESVHPDVDLGNRFYGFIVKKMRSLKESLERDKQNTTGTKFISIKFSEITPLLSNRFPEKGMLNALPEKGFFLLGYSPDNPEGLAEFLAAFKQTNEDQDQDALTAVNCAGFHYTDLAQDLRLIGLSFESFDKTTLFHEFTHMMQDMFESGKFDEEVNFSDEEAAELGLDPEDMKYFFDRHEFYTILENDIYQGLQKIYWSRYSDSMTWPEFIDTQVAVLKDSPLDISRLSIQKDWLTNVSSDGSALKTDYMKMLAALVALDKEDIFDDAMRRLKHNGQDA